MAKGLGDDSTLVLTKETHPLPTSRKDVISLFGAILEKGRVQKVVVEIGKPIEVSRLVAKEEAHDVPQEIPESELLLAARHAEIKEFNFSYAIDAKEHLFRAFGWLTAHNLRAKALIAHSEAELRLWLEVDEVFPVDQIFGVDVFFEEELPEDTLLLVSTLPGATDRIETSLRLSMNLPPLEKR